MWLSTEVIRASRRGTGTQAAGPARAKVLWWVAGARVGSGAGRRLDRGWGAETVGSHEPCRRPWANHGWVVSDLPIAKLPQAMPGPWVHRTSVTAKEPGAAHLPEPGTPSCPHSSATETHIQGFIMQNTPHGTLVPRACPWYDVRPFTHDVGSGPDTSDESPCMPSPSGCTRELLWLPAGRDDG